MNGYMIIEVVNFLDAITSTPIILTVLLASDSFLAFSARYLLNIPRGKRIIKPNMDYKLLLRRSINALQRSSLGVLTLM